MRQITQGPVDHREDLTFTLREVGAPEGCDKEGRDLTQVLTRALWWPLQVGPTGEGQCRA